MKSGLTQIKIFCYEFREFTRIIKSFRENSRNSRLALEVLHKS
jgi:hypothetical protein